MKIGIDSGIPRCSAHAMDEHVHEDRLAGLRVALQSDGDGASLVGDAVVVGGEDQQELDVRHAVLHLAVDVALDLGPRWAQVVEANVHRVGDRVEHPSVRRHRQRSDHVSHERQRRRREHGLDHHVALSLGFSDQVDEGLGRGVSVDSGARAGEGRGEHRLVVKLTGQHVDGRAVSQPHNDLALLSVAIGERLVVNDGDDLALAPLLGLDAVRESGK